MTPRDKARAKAADYSGDESVRHAVCEAREAMLSARAVRCWDDVERAARALEQAATRLREAWIKCAQADAERADAQREDAADAARKGEA